MSNRDQPQTLPELFLSAVRTFDRPNAFRFKRAGHYTDLSHREMLAAVREASLGLLSLNLVTGDRIALLSENRIEWPIADLAVLCAGCTDVPVYATLPARQIEYIMRDSEARAVFVSTPEQLAKVAEIRDKLPNLLHVIVFDEIGSEGALSIADLRERGRAHPKPDEFEHRIGTIGPNDWATIIYTSGTTGDPKGTILTHRNLVSNAIGLGRRFDGVITPRDTALSFLPLSHVLERTGGYYTIMMLGASIAFAEGTDTVRDDMVAVRPTFMLSVPRFYEKMYARIFEAATSGSGFKKTIFFWAVGVGRRFVKEKLENRVSAGTRIQRAVADLLVFKKLRALTGGRLRFFISGGAPLAREIAEFFHAAGIPILEGYGLTETSPVIAVNDFEHFRFGTVGKPLEDVSVRIAEDGEILVKGPNVMFGYYKKPDKTSEAVVEGWFHTGDIGHIDDTGFLHITDRKKDIIVTAGGKNVAPQPIENLFKTSKYVAEAVLVGNQRRFVSALIVPNFESLERFASAAGLKWSSRAELVRHPQVVEKIQQELDRKSEHLAGFERIKKFVLLDSPFTIEANELTPTLKVKRRVIEKKFADLIDDLYAQ